jgi:glycosyltransferase involved in cell wall biosynthesis
MKPSVVVAIPCYNEAATIAKVAGDFKKALPEAEVVVFDNNSSDGSAALAAGAGARVVRVFRQGKGNVMQAIFETAGCDALIVVDGDDTYEAADVHRLMEPVLAGEADMAVGDRLSASSPENMLAVRAIGNRLIGWVINKTFGMRCRDILSGYRAFSRRFVVSVPVLCPGFETEAEMTVQTLEAGLRIVEVPISYRARPLNSHSKLSPFKDGWRIIVTAAILFRDHQPLRLYGAMSLFSFLVAAMALARKVFAQPSLLAGEQSFLAAVVMVFTILAVLVLGIGLLLSAVNTRFKELRQIMRRRKVS